MRKNTCDQHEEELNCRKSVHRKANERGTRMRRSNERGPKTPKTGPKGVPAGYSVDPSYSTIC